MSSIVARSSARISAAVTIGRIAREPTLVYRAGMALDIRAITDDEIAAFRPAALTVFGADADAESGINGVDQHRALIGPGQAWGAFDAGTVVGTAGTFDLSVGTPGGGSLPMAGLTLVTVRPTHRRRGILRELVRLHLDDARARGFAISGLWASDAPIYGRFGYGVAAYCDVLEIANAGTLQIAPRDLDALEPIDETLARAVLPAIYARATADRPGALRRSDVWWRERRFLETPWARGGASKRRHVVARRGDELVGYVVYRQRGKFTDGVPDGRLEINELLAVDARAEASLWQFALNVDLFPTVAWWNMPADSALPWLVHDMRRVKTRRADSLWLRIEDVPAAVSARGYHDDGALRFAVDGATYELTAEAGRGQCTRTAARPALELSGQSLASLFLGCTSATQLARADLVRGDAAAIATADRLFASRVAPWCPEVF
jgi:predicted acetyltransferase